MNSNPDGKNSNETHIFCGDSHDDKSCPVIEDLNKQ